MLKTLYIENLAVIEQMTVDFKLGLTVFTGETGAGKSILIDAINLVLGQRSSKDIVRTGTKKAFVSATFSELSAATVIALEGFGYEVENDEMLISREISMDGKTSARLMGRPVTVGMLKEVSAMLVSLHGQHDNGILLNRENYLDILDSFAISKIHTATINGAVHERKLLEYRSEYQQYSKLKSEYRKISAGEQEKARLVDLLKYEISEISAVNLKPREDEILEERLSTMHNAQKIALALGEAHSAIYGLDGGGGSYDLVSSAVNSLDGVSSFNTKISIINEQLNGAMAELEDAAGKLSALLESVDFNPAEILYSEKRMDEIYELKRKYGSTATEILDYCRLSEQKLDRIELSEKTALELFDKLQTQKNIVMNLGRELSDSRAIAGVEFASQICEALRFLDMPNVEIKVLFSKTKYGAHGCDEVDFLFSTNKGEEPKSIEKIASGGELSRIMLAIKSVLVANDEIGTLIFDEIDAGVSGSSAQKIGLKLKQVSHPLEDTNRQVLCVTHSAQIAALAEHNFLIKKETQNERTYTKIIPLDKSGKIHEVARIMSTDKITDLMLETAKSMVSGT